MADLCPICLKKHDIMIGIRGNVYPCDNREHTSVIDESVMYDCDEIELQRRYNAIYNFVYDNAYVNKQRQYWRFFYEKDDNPPEQYGDINVYHLMKSYPYDIVSRVNAILLNIYKLCPTMADTFKILDVKDKHPRLFYPECLKKGYEKSVKEFISIYALLHNQKFIELRVDDKEDPNEKEYALTYTGLKKIEELKANNKSTNKIFIAMKFDKSVEYIENAFKQAIVKAGFMPSIIKDKEHNNYIMPEIFYEIDNCKGMVVDLTVPNFGAYFEAGYGLGKGKEVICCCKKEVFEEKKPHFDIAQKNIVIWENEEDLVKNLVRRIEATIKA